MPAYVSLIKTAQGFYFRYEQKPLKSYIILQTKLPAFQVFHVLQGNDTGSGVGCLCLPQHRRTRRGQQIRQPVCPSDPQHGAGNTAALVLQTPSFNQFATFFVWSIFGYLLFSGPPLKKADFPENEKLAFVVSE